MLEFARDTGRAMERSSDRAIARLKPKIAKQAGKVNGAAAAIAKSTTRHWRSHFAKVQPQTLPRAGVLAQSSVDFVIAMDG